MNYSKHSIERMTQRGITPVLAELVYVYGEVRGDKIVLNKKMAMARLVEARAERAHLSKQLDLGVADLVGTLHQLAELEAEIRGLCKLVDKHGATLVVSGETLITVYGIH